MNLVDYSSSLLSVVPALIALLLAIATRRVLLSLSLGSMHQCVCVCVCVCVCSFFAL